MAPSARLLAGSAGIFAHYDFDATDGSWYDASKWERHWSDAVNEYTYWNIETGEMVFSLSETLEVDQASAEAAPASDEAPAEAHEASSLPEASDAAEASAEAAPASDEAPAEEHEEGSWYDPSKWEKQWSDAISEYTYWHIETGEMVLTLSETGAGGEDSAEAPPASDEASAEAPEADGRWDQLRGAGSELERRLRQRLARQGEAVNSSPVSKRRDSSPSIGQVCRTASGRVAWQVDASPAAKDGARSPSVAALCRQASGRAIWQVATPVAARTRAESPSLALCRGRKSISGALRHQHTTGGA